MTHTRAEKIRLRRQVLEARRALPSGEVAARSAVIHQRFWELDCVRDCDLLLSYVAALENEVETLPLLHEAVGRGIRVLAPVCAPGGQMSWAPLAPDAEPSLPQLDACLVRTPRGLLEPSAPPLPELPEGNHVICVTPGIVFAPSGRRIGYGGGYYDRFLPELRRRYGTSACAVGLAFELQVAPHLPREDHDVPVDLVLTERRCLQAGAVI